MHPTQSLRQRLFIPAAGLADDDALGCQKIGGIFDVRQCQPIDEFALVFDDHTFAHRVARIVEFKAGDTGEIGAAVGAFIADRHCGEWLGIGELRIAPVAKRTAPVAAYP